MSLPQSRGAYRDYYKLWEAATSDPAGVRVRVASHETAIYHRHRLHKARSILKDESRELYEPGDPRYNISPYDHYMITIRRIPNEDTHFYLIISPRTLGILGALESLTGTEYEPQWQSALEHEPTPQLSSPSGTKLLEMKSASISDAPSDRSSSAPSTKLDSPPLIPGLRRS